jgi:hypothetical protein
MSFTKGIETECLYLKERALSYIKKNYDGWEQKEKSFIASDRIALNGDRAQHLFLYMDIWNEKESKQLYLLFDVNCKSNKMLVSLVIDFEN